MNLVRWEPFEPFKEVEKMFNEFSFVPFLPKTTFGWEMAVNLYESKGNVIAEIQLPGIAPEKIEVTFQNGDLKISAVREEKEQKEEKGFYFKEFRYGAFERLVKLPYAVKTEKTKAEFKDGILKIILPKKEEVTEKVKVQIQ
jgi:HSP20 family protein